MRSPSARAPASRQWLRGMPRCEVYTGHGRFRSAREIEVADQVLSADRIFINVGGRATVPTMPGLDRVPFLNNSSMMQLDIAPKHLLIVGGSYIGLEFGQMFRRFGSEVTIIEMGPRLVSAKTKRSPPPSTTSSPAKASTSA